MANIGDKYIIEIRDLGVGNDTYYIKNSVFNHSVVSGRELQGFEKYDPEADYQRGLNDAWELTQKIFRFVEDGGMRSEELRNAFGTGVTAEIAALPVEKVMSTLTTYETKKRAEEEIKVGDEVENDYIGNGIITRKTKDDGWYVVIDKDFYRHTIHKSHIIKKTGRHFPQVAELLDAMKEKE